MAIIISAAIKRTNKKFPGRERIFAGESSHDAINEAFDLSSQKDYFISNEKDKRMYDVYERGFIDSDGNFMTRYDTSKKMIELGLSSAKNPWQYDSAALCAAFYNTIYGQGLGKYYYDAEKNVVPENNVTKSNLGSRLNLSFAYLGEKISNGYKGNFDIFLIKFLLKLGQKANDVDSNIKRTYEVDKCPINVRFQNSLNPNISIMLYHDDDPNLLYCDNNNLYIDIGRFDCYYASLKECFQMESHIANFKNLISTFVREAAPEMQREFDRFFEPKIVDQLLNKM